MEKSLPNPIALAPRATTQETWRVLAEQKEEKTRGDTNTDWVEAAADEQIKHSIFMTEIKTR